jgi:hypothetical protein
MNATTDSPDHLAPPLRSARQAAQIARLALGEASSGVAVMMLDDDYWPIGTFTIADASGPSVVLSAVELLAVIAVDAPRLGRVVVVDARHGGDCQPDDLDLLLESSALLEPIGVCLIELIVLTDDMYVPIGAASGLPSQW